MEAKQKAPGKLESATKPTQRALNSESEHYNKDTNLLFKNAHRQRVYELFLKGEKLTTVRATVELRIPDFRSHVRYIRSSGIVISDYFVRTKFSKYKVYFLHTEQATGSANTKDSRHEEIE